MSTMITTKSILKLSELTPIKLLQGLLTKGLDHVDRDFSILGYFLKKLKWVSKSKKQETGV